MSSLPRVRNEISLGNLISSMTHLLVIVAGTWTLSKELGVLREEQARLSENVRTSSQRLNLHLSSGKPHGEARDRLGSLESSVEAIRAGQARLEAKIDRLYELQFNNPQ